MCSTKKISICNVKALAISLLLALTIFHNNTLFAQNFNLGIYGYDAPGPVRFFNANEQQLIYSIHATYITGMEESSQDSIIAFYGRQPEVKKAGLEHDPTYNLGLGPYYPITGSHQQDETNTILWAYISRNDSTTDIQNTQNETWANTVNVSSAITVPSGKTLTIAANSTVQLYSALELKVRAI